MTIPTSPEPVEDREVRNSTRGSEHNDPPAHYRTQRLTKMGHTAATAEPNQLGEGELWCYIFKEVVISFGSHFRVQQPALTWSPKAEPDLDDEAREQVTEGRGRSGSEHVQGRQIPQPCVTDRCVVVQII